MGPFKHPWNTACHCWLLLTCSSVLKMRTQFHSIVFLHKNVCCVNLYCTAELMSFLSNALPSTSTPYLNKGMHKAHVYPDKKHQREAVKKKSNFGFCLIFIWPLPRFFRWNQKYCIKMISLLYTINLCKNIFFTHYVSHFFPSWAKKKNELNYWILLMFWKGNTWLPV